MTRDQRKMKDSDVDWLGEIPAHWDLLPIKAFTKRKRVKNRSDLQLLSVYRDYGVIPKDSRDDNYNRASLDLSAYQVVDIDDLAINKMKTWQGSLAVSQFCGIVSPAYIICELYGNVHPRFIHHLLRSSKYIAQFASRSYGVRPAQWDMRYDDFKEIVALIPPLHEQRAIASYLDRETARIDRLINKTEVLNALLSEKRVALISQAVTKGLDAGAEMKESGVEWLGEIPSHWDLSSLRHTVTIHDHRRIPLNGEQRASIPGDYPYCGANGIVDYIDGYIFDGEYVLLAEDGGYWGQHERSAYRMSGKFWVNNHAHILQSIPSKSDNGFICYTLVHADIDSCITGSTRGKLNQSAMRSIPLPHPPLHEQRAIASYLDRETARIDALIKKNDELIALLREKRTALISAAVTGKIEVDLTPAPAPPGG